MKLLNLTAVADGRMPRFAPLTFLAGFSAFFFLLGGVCCLFFDKYQSEHQAWITLAKFGASLCTYAVTMNWMTDYMRCGEKLKRRATLAAVGGSVLVLLSLFTHAALLTALPSLNDSFSVCTTLARLAIVPPTAFIVVAFKTILTDLTAPTALRRSLLWATGLAILGCLPAILMLLPEMIRSSTLHVFAAKNAHESLKVAHFIGLHALQFLPICCWFVSVKGASLERQTEVIDSAGQMIFSLTFVLMFKGILNEAVIAPGILTSMMVAITALTACRMMMVFFGSPVPNKI